MNFGMNVRVVHKDKNAPKGEKQVTYNNVTEIHYNYDRQGKIALESNVHLTGCTIYLEEVLEFEALVAEKKEEYF